MPPPPPGNPWVCVSQGGPEPGSGRGFSHQGPELPGSGARSSSGPFQTQEAPGGSRHEGSQALTPDNAAGVRTGVPKGRGFSLCFFHHCAGGLAGTWAQSRRRGRIAEGPRQQPRTDWLRIKAPGDLGCAGLRGFTGCVRPAGSRPRCPLADGPLESTGLVTGTYVPRHPRGICHFARWWLQHLQGQVQHTALFMPLLLIIAIVPHPQLVTGPTPLEGWSSRLRP